MTILSTDYITVDDRQATHRINKRAKPSHRREMAAIAKEVPLEQGRLEFGDYAWLAHPDHKPMPVGVEISTFHDLISKRNSGRFGFQMHGLRAHYEVPILIVKGDLSMDDGQGNILVPGAPSIPRQALQALTDAATFHGVIVFDGYPTDASVAKRIADTYRYLAKAPEDHKLIRDCPVGPTMTMSEGLPVDEQVFSLMSIQVRGFGETVARAVMQHFGSYGDFIGICILAKTEPGAMQDLLVVPGIGKILATRLVKFVNREYPR